MFAQPPLASAPCRPENLFSKRFQASWSVTSFPFYRCRHSISWSSPLFMIDTWIALLIEDPGVSLNSTSRTTFVSYETQSVSYKLKRTRYLFMVVFRYALVKPVGGSACCFSGRSGLAFALVRFIQACPRFGHFGPCIRPHSFEWPSKGLFWWQRGPEEEVPLWILQQTIRQELRPGTT